jgi:hypothetical protein
MSYTNADGLQVLTFGDKGAVKGKGLTTESIVKQLVVELPAATALATTVAASDIKANDPFIPANAYITNAYFITRTTFTSGGSAALNIGLYTAAGAAIVANGIDAAIALSALDAGDVVRCDGTLSGGTLTVGGANAYVGFDYDTAAFTAGKGTLVIEYIEV